MYLRAIMMDLFSIFYAAICTQVSKSSLTTVVIMAADAFHLFKALRTIFHGRKPTTSKSDMATVEQPDKCLDELLRTVESIFKQVNGVSSRSRIATPRVLAPFPLPLSDESKFLLTELMKTDKFTNSVGSNRRRSKKSIKPVGSPSLGSIPNQHQILPENPTTPHSGLKHTTKKRGNEEIVHDALQNFFHSEYMLLSEYIEFMVPLLYAPYLISIFHLP
ncbi:hypothetical protein PHMEG_00029076, partial [Phytophthora megakarya]